MTALRIALQRQVERTLVNPTRLTAIIITLVVIATIGFWTLIESTPSVLLIRRYGSTLIAPVETEVCIGGTISYPITVAVDANEIPNQIEIAEAWCKAGLTGTCFGVQPGGMDPNAKRLPILAPRQIVTTSKRLVPETLTPGLYEFWHSSIDSSNRVQAYIVSPITVKDCQVTP